MSENKARDALELAESLTGPQRAALLKMTAERQYPGKTTFTAGAAWSLSWTTPRLVERVNVLTATARRRTYREAYFATPTGLAVIAALARAHPTQEPHHG